MYDIFSSPWSSGKSETDAFGFLEYEEEKRLFAAIKSRCEHSYRLPCSCRHVVAVSGEAIGVTWNDVQDQRVKHWLTKSNRSRTVLSPGVHEKQHISHMSSLKVLLDAQSGPVPPDLECQRWKLTGYRRSGRSAYSLRHTCASRLVRGGIDIRRVQMWLGHQTPQMTMRCAHLATHDLDSCVKVLEVH